MRVFVEAGVGEVVEHDHLSHADPGPQPLGEPCRGADVVRADRDLGARGDPAERLGRVVGEDGVGLAEEGLERLRRAAADEVLEACTNSGFSSYIAAVKQNGKMPWITVSATVGSPRASERHISTSTRR